MLVAGRNGTAGSSYPRVSLPALYVTCVPIVCVCVMSVFRAREAATSERGVAAAI